MAKNTTPSLPVWVQDISLEDIGRRGGHAIHVYCHGYWGDVITIYVRREFDLAAYRAVGRTAGSAEELPATWNVTMSHSSGGRDTGEITDDVEAEAVFGQGILAAVQAARVLRSPEIVAELEKHYQAEARARSEREAAKEAEAAAAKAARAAQDTLFSATKSVSALMDEVDAAARGLLHIYELGAEDGKVVEFRSDRRGTRRFYTTYGVAIPRQQVLDMLQTASVRTCVVKA